MRAGRASVWRSRLGYPAVWLMLVAGSGVAAACGSSDQHRASRGGGGASGEAGALAEAGTPSSNAGGNSDGANGGAAGVGGASAVAGEPNRSGGAGGETSLGGEAGAEAGGAGGMGGAAANGCLALHFGSDLATVQVPDLTIPDFGNEGTIELWILPDEGEPGLLVAGGCLFNKWVSFQEDKFFFLNSDASLSVYFAQQVANFTSTPAVVPRSGSTSRSLTTVPPAASTSTESRSGSKLA